MRPTTIDDRTAFDDVFQKIDHRKVGGGPKAMAADKFIFVGNLGRGRLVLTSRVRLTEPQESFLTSSNHRLRDSHVGRAGHWVDIRVAGPCPDTDLEQIRLMVQAADDRLVIVRRKERRATVVSDAQTSFEW